MTKRSVPFGIRSLIRMRLTITGLATISLLGGAGLTAVGRASTGTGSSTPAAVAGQVYVSPTGSDSNPGTAAAPVQSIGKAQTLVRALDQNMTSDVKVVL